MAMVLDAFASYVTDLLTQVVDEEVTMLLGVTGDIENMGVKLGDLKKFLADADRRNITDESVQGWVAELKRAMYEANNILDLCHLKAMARGPSTLKVGCFNPLLFCLRNPVYAHNIGSRIKALNKKLDNIKKRSADFSFILGSYEDRGSRVLAEKATHARESTGQFNRAGVVGEKIEEDTRALVARILQTRNGVDNDNMVVAIVGVGGIGKTTLSQMVFNDDSIRAEFDKKIWLSVNQNFDKTELLRTAITLAGGDHHGEKVLAVLQPIFTTALTGKKVFLVLDDLWSHGAWDSVFKTPFNAAAASGSRVLITTRHESVARGMKATWPHHHIDTLSPGDAWSLLKKQVLSSELDEDRINTLKDIGLKIIQKCGGLPLAIKVMGGLLCQREMQRRDWEQILDDYKWSMSKMPEDLNNAVYLSYEDMPSYLKQCFLFYSLLPKSKDFNVFEVVAMWISEGFISGNSNDDLEEMGIRYYKELMSRNLIELDKSYFDFWCGGMHDVVRSFAHYVTREEALVAQNGEMDILSKLHSQKFLRLSIETGGWQSGELDWKSLQEQQSVRTLISTLKIKMKPGDSLATFSSLRILYIECADVAALVESLHKLKHLRYLALLNNDISVLPGNISKMKLLQHLDLSECKQLVNLPDSIVKLGNLRLLGLPEVSMVPRGFRSMTNMRALGGYRAHMDGDWCSLDELGPLSQLRLVQLVQLENVSTASSAANARLGEKTHLTKLVLSCTSKPGHDGSANRPVVSEEEQRQIKILFDELCPPPCVQDLQISGYFGQQLPSWMMSTSTVPHHVNLKVLFISDLACCTQFPSGLCQLPYLEFLQVDHAPCIKRVETEFLHPSQVAAAPFPRLQKMELLIMEEWEEWEWEEQVQAMPRLEELLLNQCKLGRVPPGLASQARALRELSLKQVKQLRYLEKFPSVVDLAVVGCPHVERISDVPKLQKLTITDCPKMKVLKDVPALQRMVLADDKMETIPEYMRDVNPRHLELKCSHMLVTSIAAAGQSGPEFAKFSHVEHVKARGAYASDLFVLYKRKPYSFDTNVNLSFLSGGTLTIFEDAQRLESVLKMPRRAFDYVCSLAKEQSLQDMNKYTFTDGRLLCLEDRVAIALIVLNSGETLATIGSSVGVNAATVSQVTQSFIEAMCMGSLRWPGTDEMEKIKSKFDNIHGLPNCCGVLHTTRIPFESQNSDREKKNEDLLMQVVVDPDMRFTSIWFGSSCDKNQLSLLQDSQLFKECDKGARLNGSKLKVSPERSEVGEYLIGDAGYPLRPWLLTPYHLENDLPDIPSYQAEFNRRHSAAGNIALKALARLEHTWKFMHGGWRPDTQFDMCLASRACCILHNIVIDMEEEGAGMSSDQEVDHSDHEVRQLADEDAVRARDILSQHLLTSMSSQSGVDAVNQEEQQEIVASSG